MYGIILYLTIFLEFLQTVDWVYFAIQTHPIMTFPIATCKNRLHLHKHFIPHKN